MSFSFSGFDAALKAGARISADDVLALRREIWPDGAVSDAEASALFDLNRAARDAGPEWTAFFVELTYDSGFKYPFKFTSEISIVPVAMPHQWSESFTRYASTKNNK